MHRRVFLRALGGAGALVVGGGVAAVVLRPDGEGAARLESGASRTDPTPRARNGRTSDPNPRPAADPAGREDRHAVAAEEDEPTPEAEPEPTGTDGEAPQQDEPASTAAAVAVTLHCRETWGARPPTRGYDAHSISRLTVHHTAVSGAGWDPGRILLYQERHQERGMADLAYHVLVSPTGDAYEGRPFSAAGETFTSYDPTGHLNVVLEGNFDDTHPSDAQLETLAALLAWGAATYGADPATISGHQRYATTACPGSSLQRVVSSGELRAEVDRLLAAGGADLRRTC